MSECLLGSTERLDAVLREAAGQLRANSRLIPSENCMPLLGVILLCHDPNRFDAAHRESKAEIVAGRSKLRLRLAVMRSGPAFRKIA